MFTKVIEECKIPNNLYEVINPYADAEKIIIF